MDRAVTIIEPRRGWQAIDWGELWNYRDLLYFLTWRDVKVRYKQTVLGAAWAIIQPVTSMVIFSIFFGRLAGLDKQIGDVPYPIWVYAGLLPWTFFAGALTRSAQSVVAEERLITKVYFPRLIIPAASAGSALVDLAVAFSVLIVMMFWYGRSPSLGVILVPALVAATVVTAVGTGMLLSALNVAYRDFRYVIPFMIQIWMFATPVVYPVSIVPEDYQWLLCLNPMAGLIQAHRAALLGQDIQWVNLALSAGVGMGCFFLGIYCFRRMERSFADVI